MPTNVYFTQGTKNEQYLVEDLIIESLKIYGQDFFYIPRTLVSKDEILGEDRLSKFTSSFPIEMYFENVDSLDGQGAFIQKFGSQDGFGVTAPGSPNQIYMWPNHTFPLPDGTYLVLDDYTIRHISESGEVLKVTRLDVWCPGTNGAMFTPDGTFFCAFGNYIEVRFPDGTKTRIGN